MAVAVARRGPNPSYVQRLTAAGSHTAPERLEKDAAVKISPGDVVWQLALIGACFSRTTPPHHSAPLSPPGAPN